MQRKKSPKKNTKKTSVGSNNNTNKKSKAKSKSKRNKKVIVAKKLEASAAKSNKPKKKSEVGNARRLQPKPQEAMGGGIEKAAKRKRSYRPSFAISKTAAANPKPSALPPKEQKLAKKTIYKKLEPLPPPPPSRANRRKSNASSANKPKQKSNSNQPKRESKRREPPPVMPPVQVDFIPPCPGAPPLALLEESDLEKINEVLKVQSPLPLPHPGPLNLKRKSIRPDIEKYAKYTLLSTDNLVKTKLSPAVEAGVFSSRPAKAKEIEVSPYDTITNTEQDNSPPECALNKEEIERSEDEPEEDNEEDRIDEVDQINSSNVSETEASINENELSSNDESTEEAVLAPVTNKTKKTLDNPKLTNNKKEDSTSNKKNKTTIKSKEKEQQQNNEEE